jgi:hypothetical protein
MSDLPHIDFYRPRIFLAARNQQLLAEPLCLECSYWHLHVKTDRHYGGKDKYNQQCRSSLRRAPSYSSSCLTPLH